MQNRHVIIKNTIKLCSENYAKTVFKGQVELVVGVELVVALVSAQKGTLVHGTAECVATSVNVHCK